MPFLFGRAWFGDHGKGYLLVLKRFDFLVYILIDI